MHLIYNFYSNFAIQIDYENSHLGKTEYRDTLVCGGEPKSGLCRATAT